MTWQTFWLDQVDREVRGLRRYAREWEQVNGREWSCETGWHEAIAWLPGDYHAPIEEDGIHRSPWDDGALPHDDLRWPVECGKGCGYQFAEDDSWQQWTERLWRRADNGELRILHQGLVHPDYQLAEPGASWDATWMRRPGPDGVCLMVRCPRGDGTPGWMHDWPVDWPASNGPPWQRTGDPRQANVTARPSIAIGDPGKPGYYHGWLTDGVLSDHIG